MAYYTNAERREQRRRAVLAGLCTRCPEGRRRPAQADKKHCAPCEIAPRENRERRKDAGLCSRNGCQEPAYKASLCEHMYRVERARTLFRRHYGYMLTERDGGKFCRYKAAPVCSGPLHVDRVDPKRTDGDWGYGYTVDNCVWACAACNRLKGDCTPEEAGMTLDNWPPIHLSSGYRLLDAPL